MTSIMAGSRRAWLCNRAAEPNLVHQSELLETDQSDFQLLEDLGDDVSIIRAYAGT